MLDLPSAWRIPLRRTGVQPLRVDMWASLDLGSGISGPFWFLRWNWHSLANKPELESLWVGGQSTIFLPEGTRKNQDPAPPRETMVVVTLPPHLRHMLTVRHSARHFTHIVSFHGCNGPMVWLLLLPPLHKSGDCGPEGISLVQSHPFISEPQAGTMGTFGSEAPHFIIMQRWLLYPLLLHTSMLLF